MEEDVATTPRDVRRFGSPAVLRQTDGGTDGVEEGTVWVCRECQ